MKGKYCVLFALGDVLADTGAHYKTIWKKISDKYGSETDDLLNVTKEKSIEKILAKYFSHLTQDEKDNLVNELENAESKMKVREIYGASGFVKELKDEKVKMGLVTSFTKKQVDSIAKQVDFINLMDTVVTAEDIDRLKPDPQGYLQAAHNLDYDPADCFVFEDSIKGIEAAKSAGMNVIALSTTNTPQELQKHTVSKIIPDFSGISIADLNMLYQKNEVVPGKIKKSSPWIYLLLLLLILVGIFLLWRSCGTNWTEMPEGDAPIVTTEIESPRDQISANAPEIEVLEIESVDLALTDGSTVNARKGGMEDQIVAFLNSDNYRNATEDDLKDKWFDFDNIEFLHGSSSELTEASYPQLNNLAQILKQFKNVKIKVGGYTDKTGTEETNQRISQERANTIKSYLVNQGLTAANISAEGYGSKFAKHSAGAPDSQRMEDRKIALRFVK